MLSGQDAAGTPSHWQVQRKVEQLKRKDWAMNPFALKDDHHLRLQTQLMRVLKGMMGIEHDGVMSDMTGMTFWSVLSQLVRGRVLTLTCRYSI